MSDLRRIGDEGEARAAKFLQDKGYTIVTRNFHSRSGEIDLVALDGDQLVCVEVKTRTSRIVPAETALDQRKSDRIVAAARDYLRSVGEPGRSVRFDLIAIDPDGLRHHEGAL